MPGTIAERLVKWLVGPSMGMLALFAVFGVPRRKSLLKGNADGTSALPAKGGVVEYGGSLLYFAALGFGFIAV